MSEGPAARSFDVDGSPVGDVLLDPEVFGAAPNIPLMHQVVTAQLAAARVGSANTKTRAEVRGGGRKPWRQKGLGRARHGSRRSPQWAGGGVVHGPKPRSYRQRTPKKMRRLALHSALSTRAAEGRITVIGTPWSEPRTKKARAFLSAVEASGKALVVHLPSDAVTPLAFRNLPDVVVTSPGQLTAYDVLWADHVIFTADALGATAGSGSFDVSPSDFVKEGDDE